MRSRGHAIRGTLAIAWLAALAPILGSCAPAKDEDGARHLFLITVDTWRGDHLSVERGGVPLTPALDEWSAEAVRFLDANSVGPETSPGIAGLMTGLFPWNSGVMVNVHIVPPNVPTLATRLREHGFATAAWVANPVLGPGTGFDRGFEEFALVPAGAGELKARGPDLVDRAWRWIDSRSDERLFVWIHLMEPHGPYDPPAEERARFPLDAFGPPEELSLQPAGENSGRGGVPHYQWSPLDPAPTDARDYRARYCGEVRAADRAVGAFLQRLADRGLDANSTVVLSSDHGEALAGEQGFWFSHGNGLTQDQVHVPLLVAWPEAERGRRVERPVSTMDVTPTVMRLLGLPGPADIDGVDLFGGAESSVVAASANVQMLREGPWRLRAQGPRAFLTHREREPAEDRNLAAEEPATLRQLLGRLQLLRTRRAPLGRSIERNNLTDEQRQQLEALGYL